MALWQQVRLLLSASSCRLSRHPVAQHLPASPQPNETLASLLSKLQQALLPQAGLHLEPALAGLQLPPQPAAGEPAQRLQLPNAASLWDSLWMAVPKRKVTPHRKGMRNTHNKLKFTPIVAQCSVCQRIMGMHEVPVVKVKKDGRMNPVQGTCKHADCPSAPYRHVRRQSSLPSAAAPVAEAATT